MRQLAGALALVCAGGVFAATGDCGLPTDRADGWPVAADRAATFDQARLCAALDAFARHPANLHGIVVERHGRLVAEAYRTGVDHPNGSLLATTTAFDADTRHDLRSISKSVVSLLWGIAQAQGPMPALDAHVVDLLPELEPFRNQGRELITVEDLFAMRSGLAWTEAGTYGTLVNDENGLFWRGSQARYLFDRPLAAPPGSRFNYNGGHTAVLALLLAQHTGVPLTEFARRSLFEPLGITDWEWRTDLRGRPLAFAGLRLRPRDLTRLGRMALDGGRWKGRQIVPAEWLRASLQPRIATGDGIDYAYQWWTGAVPASGKLVEWQAGFGNGGQRLFMVPALDLVVVITAGEYNKPQVGRDVYRLFAAVVAATQAP